MKLNIGGSVRKHECLAEAGVAVAEESSARDYSAELTQGEGPPQGWAWLREGDLIVSVREMNEIRLEEAEAPAEGPDTPYGC